MKFSEIENRAEEQKKQEQEQELTKLQEQSMKARMEYENTLLKESLEKSKRDYEKLNSQSMEMLRTASKKIEELKQSNEILSQSFTEEISILKDRAIKLLDNTTSKFDSLMNENLGQISTKSTEYIQEVERIKEDAKKRFKSFYGRKKILDYLIIANLTLTPIILVIITYFLFLKK